MSGRDAYADAVVVLSRHGYSTAGLTWLGAGGQSDCLGTAEIAVLLGHAADENPRSMRLDGRLGRTTPVSGNGYPAMKSLSTQARVAGVRTPEIVAVGEDPRPHAVIRRAPGTLASAHPDLAGNTVSWFGRLGAQLRKVNDVHTTGFGRFVPDGSCGYRGCFASWAEYLDHWLAMHLCVGGARAEDAKVLELVLAQQILTEADLAVVAEKVRQAQTWLVSSVLTHYDNRFENVVVDSDGVTVLDWGLAFAGIGIAQELVKVFEVAPVSLADPRVAAFLQSYGLSESECRAAVEAGGLMLVLDGLAMSYGWADQPERLPGIRAWLRTVSRLCRTW